MKELEYPFDAQYLIKYQKKLKKELLLQDNLIVKNIAVLGGSTTRNIIEMLELFLLNQGIRPVFYESEYNRYYEDAAFPNRELEQFNPDFIYICTSNRNILNYPSIQDDNETVNRKLETEYGRYKTMWEHLNSTYQCPVIQNNFEYLPYRLLGNQDVCDYHGKTNFISKLNRMFAEYAEITTNFFLCDINYISAQYGLDKWADNYYWHMYKYALCINAIPDLAFNVSNIVKSILGKNKKALVLDLDNTLWGGVIGDDGLENIKIGQEDPEGQAYYEFQNYLKELKALGILLCVDSKNDYENAIQGLSHPEGALHKEDFVCIKANWKPKSENMAEIVNELQILPESLVFIDDNPTEREIVRQAYRGGVIAPDIDKVEDSIKKIDHAGFFEITRISQDDLKRTQMYMQNMERKQLQVSFADYNDFLISLQMRAVIKPFEPIYYARIAQLTNKSNQYNLTTKRCTQSDIEFFAESQEYITLYGKLEDKFGDNGVVSLAVGHIIENICHIEIWLMSCRVLKRNMEYAMMDSFVEECNKRGIQEIRGYYYPTSKNKMVSDFYELQGFKKTMEDGEGNTESVLFTGQYHSKNNVIQIMEEKSNE